MNTERYIYQEIRREDRPYYLVIDTQSPAFRGLTELYKLRTPEDLNACPYIKVYHSNAAVGENQMLRTVEHLNNEENEKQKTVKKIDVKIDGAEYTLAIDTEKGLKEGWLVPKFQPKSIGQWFMRGSQTYLLAATAGAGTVGLVNIAAGSRIGTTTKVEHCRCINESEWETICSGEPAAYKEVPNPYQTPPTQGPTSL